MEDGVRTAKLISLFFGIAAVCGLLASCIMESSSSEEYECCYNGAYYDCPNEEELNKCAMGEDSDCDRQPTNDDQCEDDDSF